MTCFARLLSAAMAATSVVALATAADAAVTVRPTISVPVVHPTISVPVVRPSVPTVHPVVATPVIHPVVTVAKPAVTTPTVRPNIVASTLPSHVSESHVAVPGVPLPAKHVAIPPHPTSSTAAELGGKPVIKVSYVNGNELTVYYLSQDAQHIVGVVSGISEPPATHVPPQNVGTVQPQQPASSMPAVNSGQKITFTPVSYPELTDQYGSPAGYINAQGQAVYFPNGHMPQGFTLGPNHTIETYTESVSEPPATHVPPQTTTNNKPASTQPGTTPNPASKPAQPQPQQKPSSSKPATSVTFKPVSYPELTDQYGSPAGYINAQGQAIYFPNGHMPQGFSLGPNHTIETYVRSN